jgi:hypothetical protein
MVHQVRRAFCHPAAAATGAETTAFTGERHEPIKAAPATAEPRKPTGQPPAPQEVPKLLVDEAGQPLAISQRRRLHAERLEMVPDDLVERPVRGLPRCVRRRGLAHPHRARGCDAKR